MNTETIFKYTETLAATWDFYQMQTIRVACGDPVADNVGAQRTKYYQAEQKMLDEIKANKAAYIADKDKINFLLSYMDIKWPVFPDKEFQNEFDAFRGVGRVTHEIFDHVRKLREYLQRDYTELKESVKDKAVVKKRPYITHRVRMFAHQYKVDVGLAEYKSGADWFNEAGKKGRAKIQFATLAKTKPSKTELAKILELLKDFPAAYQNALDKN